MSSTEFRNVRVLDCNAFAAIYCYYVAKDLRANGMLEIDTLRKQKLYNCEWF